MHINNIMIIAKKEFTDLIINWMVLLILTTYIILMSLDIFNFYGALSSNTENFIHLIFHDNAGVAAANIIFWDLTQYGSVLGVMIGCLTISNERHNHALNTLLVKPLFRDTIINGKFLGSMAFIVFIICISIMFYSSSLIVLCGNSLSPFIGDYISGLIIVFIFSIIYITFFLILSACISIIVKNQAFAMILSLITLYVSDLMHNYVFAQDISTIIGNNNMTEIVISLSPSGMVLSLFSQIFYNWTGIYNALSIAFPYIVKLLLYTAIACIISYILFIRSDVS
jgi:ABC-2 type transport system permease protein